MRTGAIFLAFFGLAANAGARVGLDTLGILGISETYHYYGSQTEVSAPLGKGFYTISARARTFRLQEAAPGGQEEYSAGLRRNLYHVTVVGRLGTAPPNMAGTAYHLAGGEVRFTLYGWTLGPELPELSAQVWESSGSAPSPDSFDKTWVTTFRGIYTNTDHHIIEPALPLRPETMLVIVQNSWQLEARETWKERTSLTLQTGHHLYNKVIQNRTEDILLNNVDYLGSRLGIVGWPNNYISAEASQKFWSGWQASIGFTRLNLLKNKLDVLYGTELDAPLISGWHIRSGYYYRRNRHTASHQGLSLGVAYRW